MPIQKALWLPKVGAEFTLGPNDIPEPGPGEVLVQLKATALNPLEWKTQRSGFFMVKEYPAIIGEDGAGVVRKVGDGVTHLSPGDGIFFQTSFGNKYTTYQEYCLANAQRAVKIPPNVSFEQAASIATGFNPFAVATYAQQPEGLGLTPPFEEGGLGKYANQPIVIMGGASSLGQYVVWFLSIFTTASPHNTDYLMSRGATHILDRTLPAAALSEQIARVTRVPITYIFDAVSLKETQQTALSLLAPGGTLVVVTTKHVHGAQDDKKVHMVVGSFHFAPNQALGAKFATALAGWLAEGTIKPNNVEVLPGGLEGIPAGLKRLEMNGVSASKLIVRPAETA